MLGLGLASLLGGRLSSSLLRTSNTKPLYVPNRVRQDDTNNSSPLKSPAPISLRNYQQEAIEKCLRSFQDGINRFGVSLPTGSGKTTVMVSLIPKFPFRPPLNIANSGLEGSGDRETKGKTLILVHKTELVNQMKATAQMILGDSHSVEVEQGTQIATGQADITIAMAPTITNPERLAKFDPRQYKLVLVDEAHHAACPSWLKILHHFNSNIDTSRSPQHTPVQHHAHQNKVPIVGFTATWTRWDKRELGKAFEKVVYHLPISHLIRRGYLVPAKMEIAHATLKLDELKSAKMEDYSESDLDEKVNTHEVNELVVRMYHEKASDRRSTVVFCVSLAHVRDLSAAFIKSGVDARSVSGQTPREERSRLLREFGEGLFPVLLNCVVLIEGTDIPPTDCLLLARPTKSQGLALQMIGRGLRPSPNTGKKDCLVIDLVDNQTKLGSLDVIPELWSELSAGTGRWGGEGGPVQEPVYKKNIEYKADDFKIDYIDIDDPFGLNDDDKLIVSKMSKNAWVSCGKYHWVLEIMNKGFYSVQSCNEGGSWKSTWTSKAFQLPEQQSQSQNKFWNPPKFIYRANDLGEIVRLTDTYAREHTKNDIYNLSSRNASWRNDPATAWGLNHLLSYSDHKVECSSLSFQELQSRRLLVMGKAHKISGLTKGMVSSWTCALHQGDKDLRDSIRLSNAAEQDPTQGQESGSRTISQDEGNKLLFDQGFYNALNLWDGAKDLWRRDNTRSI